MSGLTTGKIADDGRTQRAMTEIRTIDHAISNYNFNHGTSEQIKTTTTVADAFTKLRTSGYINVNPEFSKGENSCTYSLYGVCDKTHIQLTGCSFHSDAIRLYTPKDSTACTAGF